MQDQFLYIFNDPGTFRIKIGKTIRTTETRLSELNRHRETLAPTKFRELHKISCSDPLRLERLLHKAYDSSRLQGEWFELDLLEIIQICRLTSEHAERILEQGGLFRNSISNMLAEEREEEEEQLLELSNKLRETLDRIEENLSRKRQESKQEMIFSIFFSGLVDYLEHHLKGVGLEKAYARYDLKNRKLTLHLPSMLKEYFSSFAEISPNGEEGDILRILTDHLTHHPSYSTAENAFLNGEELHCLVFQFWEGSIVDDTLREIYEEPEGFGVVQSIFKAS